MRNRLLNWFYFCAGILFLLLAKVRNALQGYTPKPYSTNEIERCVNYDVNIVDGWLAYLKKYTEDAPWATIENKNVLELGPGSDLGVGLCLLAKLAKNYFAVDVYDLASRVSDSFYESFFSFLKNKGIDIAPLVAELNMTRKGNSKRLNYICRKDFDVTKALAPHKVDFIFSNAAFEHFDNVYKTIEDISNVASTNAIFIALVDLKTHSRWISDKDPDNIYRYPVWLYKLLSARSTPNRIRPCQYKEALMKNGWTNIKIYPGSTLNNEKYNFVKKHLNKKFKAAENQMEYLTAWICATKT